MQKQIINHVTQKKIVCPVIVFIHAFRFVFPVLTENLS